MTLDEFCSKYGGYGFLPAMNEEQFREFMETPVHPENEKGRKWREDVIEYYKNHDARLVLIRRIHGVTEGEHGPQPRPSEISPNLVSPGVLD